MVRGFDSSSAISGSGSMTIGSLLASVANPVINHTVYVYKQEV